MQLQQSVGFGGRKGLPEVGESLLIGLPVEIYYPWILPVIVGSKGPSFPTLRFSSWYLCGRAGGYVDCKN